MTGAVLPYLALAAAGSCIWAMPWVQGPTPYGRSLDPATSINAITDEGLSIPATIGSATDPADAHSEAKTPARRHRDVPPITSRPDKSATAGPIGAAGAVTNPGAAAALPTLDRTTRPEALAIPSRGIRSTVVPVGLDASGGVVVPEDISVLGWYDKSRPLGAARGATVLVGHRDSRVQGYGTLYDIESLPMGAKLMVAGRNGTVHTYAVTRIELIDKADLPARAREIFTRQGPHHLTLITCGGAFDDAARNYLSNVVVTAAPINVD